MKRAKRGGSCTSSSFNLPREERNVSRAEAGDDPRRSGSRSLVDANEPGERVPTLRETIDGTGRFLLLGLPREGQGKIGCAKGAIITDAIISTRADAVALQLTLGRETRNKLYFAKWPKLVPLRRGASTSSSSRGGASTGGASRSRREIAGKR